MKSFFPVVALITGLGLSATTLANERPPHPPRDGGFAGMMLLKERVAERLALTETQRAQIKALVDAYKASYPFNKEQAQTRRAQFKALMDAPTFDEGQARNLLQARTERQLARMKLGHDVIQVLSPEQRDKLNRMMKRRMHRR